MPATHPIDIINIKNDYAVPTHCQFCGSDKLSFPITAFEMCDHCGKHVLYGFRFPYLEISRELLPQNKPIITKEKILQAWEDANGKYDVDNKIEGSFYHFIGLLAKDVSK